MCPTTVKGRDPGSAGEAASADLWSLGVIIFQLFFGFPSFQAPSPYLTFLKVQRGNARIPGFAPDYVKGLISMLLVKDNMTRMRSAVGELPADNDNDSNLVYSGLRSHPFFHMCDKFERPMERPVFAQIERVPTLVQLAIRAVGRACEPVTVAVAQYGAVRDVPTDGADAWIARFDLLRLREPIRGHVAYYLSRRERLHPPSTLRLFYPTAIDTKLLGRIDMSTREVIGYVRDMHIGNSITGRTNRKKIGYDEVEDEYSFYFTALSEVSIEASSSTSGSVSQEHYKKLISSINKLRPRFVMLSGNFTASALGQATYSQEMDAFRKLTAKVSETIPVLLIPGQRDVCESTPDGRLILTPTSLSAYRRLCGADYFALWYGGIRVLIVNSTLLMSAEVSTQ
jgi:serine/threonine protein kinase